MDSKKLYKGWEEQASIELRDKNLEDHFWETPEGIKVKPLYTEDDLQKISHEIGVPGLPPYTRGPRATMYTNRPWTIRQYAGFLLLRNPINFTKKD